MRGWQKLLIAFLVFCLALSHLPAQAAAPAQTDPGQYTVGDCSRIDKQQVRDEIERHALAVVNASGAPADIDSLVARKWAELDMDAAVDEAVQGAVGNLGSQEAYWDKLISAWWGEKAQEYAERIANDAFSSPAFQVKLEELSTAVGAEVARQVETQFAEAASVALLCLKEYVGEQYSEQLFRAFERSVQADTANVDLSASSPPVISAVEQHGLALAGVGTILVTQLVYRLTQKLTEKIAQRVAGKVVGRVLGKAGSSFIPVAGWIVGIALIAYDLWEGNQGALPQIQEALQSEEVKSRIREEIAAAIKDDLPDQAALIALETSVSLVEQWQGFCTRYGDVCQVADQNPDFRSLLGFVALDELDSLAALVTWFVDQEGRRSLDNAVIDGSLEDLLALPQDTLAAVIAEMQPGEAIGWLQVAGDRMGRVVDLRMHRLAQPDEFDTYSLAAMLAVRDSADLQKLLALAPVQRDILLAQPADTLQALAAGNSATELAVLANVMLEPAQSPTSAAQIAEEVVQGNVSVEQLVTPSNASSVTVLPADGSPSLVGEGAPQLEAGSAPQRDTGLQLGRENGNILLLAVWIVVLLVAVLTVVAVGYWRRRQSEPALERQASVDRPAAPDSAAGPDDSK